VSDPITIAVLSTAVAATVWLLYYVQIYLPRQLDARFVESMKAFSTAVELRFPSHAGLTDGVVETSSLLAERFRLSGAARRDLLMAARLRDIGLCAIPYHLVNGRAESNWTDAERSTYDRHPEVSGAMLELVPSLRHLAPVVRAHQSGPDEHGSPEMTIEARILRVASEYTWIRRERGEAYAYQVILERRGSAFCPEVVDALSAVLTSSRVERAQPSLA
jgi:response regulator RpfG family c-di-GMP phosphodiesterase